MMKRIAAAALVVAGGAAQAQTVVKEPWVRATVAQQRSTGAFMQLRSAKDARLVDARSPLAKTVELHEMELHGDVMQMRALNDLALPAGKPVELTPGGYHFMLVGLSRPLKEGDSVPLTLVIEGRDRQRETIEVRATVRALNTAAPAGPAHKH
jgi:hypothetical protein